MRHNRMKAARPKEDPAPTEDLTLRLFQCMAREEFKLAYAVCFLADSEDYGQHCDLTPFATPGCESQGDTWLESFRRVVRWLSLEHGFVWEGLDPQQDGRIRARQVEPRNFIYFNMLATGQSPDIEDALVTAIRLLEERAPAAPVEAFRAALADVRATLATVPGVDPDAQRQADEFAEQALGIVGVVRGSDIPN